MKTLIIILYIIVILLTFYDIDIVFTTDAESTSVSPSSIQRQTLAFDFPNLENNSFPRNIFQPDALEPLEAKHNIERRFRLAGIMKSTPSSVILEEMPQGTMIVLTEGEVKEGISIQKIEGKSVDLQVDGHDLGVQLTGEEL